MIDAAVEFATAQVPWWVAVLVVVLAFAAGRLFRRATLLEERTARRAAEREARYATARAEAAERAADAVTRALPAAEAWPEPVSETLTTRGGSLDVTAVAADYPPPALDPPDDLDRHLTQEWADPEFRAAYRRAASPRQWADVMEDITQTDEGADEAPVARYGTGLYGEVAAPTMTGPLPCYDWSATGWTPGAPAPSPHSGPAPLPCGRGLDLLRRTTVSLWAPVRWVRWVRWSLAGWSWRAAARAEARELAQAVQLLGGPDPGTAGELTGETTLLPVVGRAVVPKPPLPRSHLPVHVWGWRMVSAAAVLGRKPAGLAGRHRPEVVPGAVAQRQTRLLALPAGAS